MIVLAAVVLGSNAEAGWNQGSPLPEKKTFWLFETSWLTRVSGSNIRPNKANFLVTAEFGQMKNRNSNSAWGAFLYIGGDDDSSQWAIKLRYRIWLDKITSFDLSPGIVFSGSDNFGEYKFPGFISSASLSFGDILALTFHYQYLKFQPEEVFNFGGINGTNSFTEPSQSSFYVGAKFGSYLAIIMPVVALAIVAATFEIKTIN